MAKDDNTIVWLLAGVAALYFLNKRQTSTAPTGILPMVPAPEFISERAARELVPLDMYPISKTGTHDRDGILDRDPYQTPPIIRIPIDIEPAPGGGMPWFKRW